jgi:hypothetical protein
MTQQMVGLYETGERQPSVANLTRVVAGCGMELVWNLASPAGPEDKETLDLLAKPPLERLSKGLLTSLLELNDAARDLDLVVGGKIAARLHGAALRVYEIELWFDERIDLDVLEAYLSRAHVDYVSPSSGSASEPVPHREQLLRGWTLVAPAADLQVRCMPNFSAVTAMANKIVPPEGRNLLVASTDDCSRAWRRRDLDHLALQRAVRLAPEKVSPWGDTR